MCKRILILLAMVAALACLFTLSAAAATEENTIVRYCEYCDLVETWYPLDNTTTIESKHYYLATNVVFGAKTLKSGTTLCLELNGHTYTANRHMVLESGSVLNVQDNVGGGTMAGRGSDNFDPGRTVWIKAGSTMNLYHGKLTAATSTARGTNRGGVLAIYGTFNMFGGTVCDGIANELGGTIFLDTNGRFNMSGGTVSGGSAPSSYCCYFRGKVLLANDASVEAAYIAQNSSQGMLLKDQLTIRGKYTGSLCMSSQLVTEPGTDVGNSDNADLSEATIYMPDNDFLIRVEGTELVTYLPDAAAITSGETTTSYATLEAALAALQDGDILTLYRGTAEPVTIDKNITLDIHGRKLSNTLTAASGVTVYVKDSYTADYDIADGVYGQIKAIAGDVRGVEATESSDPYLMISESKGISFHAVGLNISGMSLKGGEAALYFNNTFAGDSLVKEQVESFGIAMSVAGEPTKDTMANSKHYTSIEGSLFGTAEGNTGSLLYGIMKEENDQKANERNAKIEVYGKAYVKLKDGRYLFGISRSRNLKTQVEAAVAQFEKISAEAQDGLRKIVERFDSVTKTWDVAAIYDYIANHEEETMKIIVLGSSGSVDAFHLLYQAFQDQYPDQKIVLGVMYYSGCTVAQHVGFYQQEAPVYSYRVNRDGTFVRHDGATLQDGLKDQKWDIVAIHGDKSGGVKKENIDLLIGYIAECVKNPYELYYDYTWPNPNDETFFSEGFDPQPPAGYKDRLIAKFGFDPNTQLAMVIQNAKEEVLLDNKFDQFVNCGPAVMYAINRLNCPQLELYRDYTHLSDYGRLIASYCWVSQITGEPITEINIDVIPAANRATFRQQALGDMAVTEEMKRVIIESVNYAMNNKFEVPLPLE